MRVHKFIFVIVLGLKSLPAFAYIDPGAGSIMIQVFVGVFAGVLFFIKRKFYIIKTLFNRKKQNQKKDP